MAPRVDSARSVADFTNDEPATIRPLHTSPGTVHNTAVGSTDGFAPTATAPTDGARTASVDPAKAQYEQDLHDWQQTKAQAESYKAANAQLDKDLAPLLEAKHALSVLLQREEFDLVLTPDELNDLMRTGSPEMKAAATWLLAHEDVWRDLPKKETLVGGLGIDMRAAQSYLADLSRRVSELEGRRLEVPEVPPKPTVPGAVPSAGATPSGGPTGATQSSASNSGTTSAADEIPLPAPSTKPGLEGATENLANAADHLQAQMIKLAEEASKDPTKATLNAQKIAMLQTQIQSLTNMMSQLQQMMSNMSKLWSDVAMNSVRNLK
jgi:hypothetical protein